MAKTRVPLLGEVKRLLHLALPLIGTQMAQMAMGVTDVVMAGRYGAVDLAGVALGGSVMWPVLMVMTGLVQALTPTVAQLHGADRFTEIGEVIRQGLWIGICGGAIAFLALNHADLLYLSLQVDPAAAAISVPYLRMCSIGAPAVMCFFCLRFLADGTGYTRPALFISVAALVLKVPLNYAFIYGRYGAPELGGVGCGVAQAFVMWLQLVLVLIVVTRPRFDFTGWRSRFSWPDWTRIKPLLILGIPISATTFAEMGLFSLTTLLLGRFGAEVVASHNIAMNINGVLFMPALALGMAGTIRIGFRVGANEISEARTTAAIVIATTIAVALLGSALIFSLRIPLTALYTTEPTVQGLSSTLLMFVGFFLLFDALQAAAVGTLRGYKDTRVPMWIALFSFWVVGLPLGCTLGFGWLGEPRGVFGFWIGLTIALGVAATSLSARLWRLSGDSRRIVALARPEP